MDDFNNYPDLDIKIAGFLENNHVKNDAR